jgi:hypothetical protein
MTVADSKDQRKAGDGSRDRESSGAGLIAA